MIALAALLAYSTALQEKPALDYRQQQEQWRAEYAKSLERPEGWLSVAGLFWLKDGANKLGSAPGCEVLLPDYASPATAGTLVLAGGAVTLSPASGVSLLVNDQPVTADTVLAADASGKPDRVRLGDVTFKVIQRGTRTGVRLYDPKCKGRTEYKGLHWFKVDPKMAVEATFVPYDPPKPAVITNVLGDTTPVQLPGYLVFKVGKNECRLDAEDAGEMLFLNFQDATSGKSTYGAGRFLDVPKPVNGKTVIDFNQATNPPCAYTAFATCPLPPAGNRLNVSIKAGEKAYGHH